MLWVKRTRHMAMALSLALFLGSCQAFGAPQTNTPAPELQEPVGVRHDYATVVRQEVSQKQVYSARVLPEVITLSFPIDGHVDASEVKERDVVEAGDTLAVFFGAEREQHEQELRDQLAEAKRHHEEETRLADYARADLAERRATIEHAETAIVDSPRGPIAKADALALLDVEARQLEATKTRETQVRETAIADLEASLKAYLTQLEQGTLVAPSQGRVINILNGGGPAEVEANEPYLELVNDRALYLESEYLPDATLQNVVSASVRIGDQTYELTPRAADIATIIDRMIAGLPLQSYYDFAQGVPDMVQAGAWGQIVLVTRLEPDALTVPVNALYHSGGTTYVYRRVDDTDQREQVEVKTLFSTPTLAVIEAGLTEGDEVYVKDN